MTRGKGCKKGMKPEVEKRSLHPLDKIKGVDYIPLPLFFFSVSRSLGYYFAPSFNLADV